ncbi:MAG: hypothetical protein QNK20_16950 [Aureibaculum sp.]|nr:hypothetical protein [Aureibaculum sp.]
MGKGFVILLIVFVCVGIVHFISMRMMKVSEDKKQKIRKVLWYIYGVILIISGLINLIEKQELNFIFLIQMVLGTGVIILNILGKIETKPS